MAGCLHLVSDLMTVCSPCTLDCLVHCRHSLLSPLLTLVKEFVMRHGAICITCLPRMRLGLVCHRRTALICLVVRHHCGAIRKDSSNSRLSDCRDSRLTGQ